MADIKEAIIVKSSEETAAEIQDETNTDEKKATEKVDGEVEDESADNIAIEVTETVEEVAIPVEDEVKTEGGESEVKPESTEGGDSEPIAVETTVTNETETEMNYFKYEELDDELPWAMYRSLDTPPQRPPVEEDEDWPASDNEEDYGKSLHYSN